MKVVSFAGGVGGAKLVEGLAEILPGEDLTVIVNTGDDFEHLGLKICPDLDTICYTLAGIANPQTGWGLVDETWNVYNRLDTLKAPTWFKLGDRDLATHLYRTHLLKNGLSLTQITRQICVALGIHVNVVPMSDDPLPTIVQTDEGLLPFQEYFVHLQCQPRVTSFNFQSIECASPAPGVLEALQLANIVVFCPSNPWVSIDPILSVPGVRTNLIGKLVIAVSPIIAGQAVKGPAAKMFTDMGIQPSALAVLHHYRDLISGFILDQADASLQDDVEALDVRALITNTLMNTHAEKIILARQVLEFGSGLIASCGSQPE